MYYVCDNTAYITIVGKKQSSVHWVYYVVVLLYLLKAVDTIGNYSK